MIRLFNAKRLAEELRRKQVGPKAKGYYLVAGFIALTFFYYSNLMSSNPPWTLLSIYEGLAAIVVMIVGFAKCHDAAGGDENPDFVVEFTCLYTPVSITTILAVWGVYWVAVLGFREYILGLSNSHLPFAQDLLRFGTNFFGLITFLAVIAVQLVTFYRIVKLFQIMRKQPAS